MACVVSCTACGELAFLPDHMAGQSIRCLGCQSELPIVHSATEETLPDRQEPIVQEPVHKAPFRLLCDCCGGEFPLGEVVEQNQQIICSNCLLQSAAETHKLVSSKRRRKIPSRFGSTIALALILLAAVIVTRFVPVMNSIPSQAAAAEPIKATLPPPATVETPKAEPCQPPAVIAPAIQPSQAPAPKSTKPPSPKPARVPATKKPSPPPAKESTPSSPLDETRPRARTIFSH